MVVVENATSSNRGHIMKLTESDLLDLLNTSPSFRETCAHTLAKLLADPVEDPRPGDSLALVGFDDMEDTGACNLTGA
jgi:hypothetical protein